MTLHEELEEYKARLVIAEQYWNIKAIDYLDKKISEVRIEIFNEWLQK